VLCSSDTTTAATADQHYQIRSLSTGRCLSNTGNSAPVLLPCDASRPEQAWAFGKGLHSPSSLYSVQSNQALGVDSSTLFSAQHKYKGGHDPYDVSSISYGETNLKMVNRQDQTNCGRRGCENYDDTQMWWFDPVRKHLLIFLSRQLILANRKFVKTSSGQTLETLKTETFLQIEKVLRLSTYTASLNHAENGGQGLSGGGTGFLTPKTPTYQHHCLAHVLSNQDTGTVAGDTEVWGGPLDGGDFVMAALNRGANTSNITLSWTMLGFDNVTNLTEFSVRDLWAKKTVQTSQAGGFTASVPSHDLAIYRLSPPSKPPRTQIQQQKQPLKSDDMGGTATTLLPLAPVRAPPVLPGKKGHWVQTLAEDFEGEFNASLWSVVLKTVTYWFSGLFDCGLESGRSTVVWANEGLTLPRDVPKNPVTVNLTVYLLL
jgi:hypothetical protein